MQQPLEIAFHNLDASPALDAEIRKRFARLEKLCDRLTACRISVEAVHNQHRTGNIYEVHIDMLVPGGQLVVSRAPHRAREKYASPDVRTSIRDAFSAAERQLKKYNRQLTGEIKRHEPEFFGQVAEVHPEEDWGSMLQGRRPALLQPQRRARRQLRPAGAGRCRRLHPSRRRDRPDGGEGVAQDLSRTTSDVRRGLVPKPVTAAASAGRR